MKKETLIAIMLLFFLFSVIILDFGLAKNEGKKTDLKRGKNLLEINQTMYVRDFVRMNPDIETVSYFDEFLNKSIGYVNVFGGVGKNFLMTPGQVYEVNAKRNTTLLMTEAA